MKTKTTIRNLGKLSNHSKSEGYIGDATEYGFRQNVLQLLEELIGEIKEISKQQKYLWQTLEESCQKQEKK